MTPKELREWRTKHNLSLAELGKELGVSRVTVFRWEKKLREIPSFLHLALKCLKVKKRGKAKLTGKKKDKQTR